MDVVPIGLIGLIGLGTLAQAVVPRATSMAGYALVVWSFLVEFGGVVRANHWLLDLSLFHHIAPAPAANLRWVADAVFVVVGVVLAGAGAALFRRRDIAKA